eukprot:g32700.t1
MSLVEFLTLPGMLNGASLPQPADPISAVQSPREAVNGGGQLETNRKRFHHHPNDGRAQHIRAKDKAKAFAAIFSQKCRVGTKADRANMQPDLDNIEVWLEK